LYQQFAITIAISVLFSSVNALSLSPALCSVLLKPSREMKGPLGWFFRQFNRGFDKATGSYTGFTRVIARKTGRGLLFLVLVSLLAFLLAGRVPGGFMPEEDMGYGFVNIQLPNAASLQRTDVVAKKVEAICAQVPGVEMVTTASGFSLLSGSLIPNNAFIFTSLAEWANRDATFAEINRQLNIAFQQEIKAAQVFGFGPPAIPGLGSGGGFSIMLQDRSGNPPEYLASNTRQFIEAAMARPEIASAFSPFQASVPQKYIEINTDKILKTGVALKDVYDTFGSFLGGAYVNDFNRFGRLYRAYIQAEPEYRQSEQSLGLFYVRNKDGESVPLSALVEVRSASGPDYINRFNLLRAAEVSGGPSPGYSSAQALDALEEVADEVLPSDMSYAFSNMSYQEKQASGSLFVIFGFSLMFVYLILSAQYESWTLPLSILLGTPLALFGAFLALYLGRLFDNAYELNIFAQISLVMLIAMAAKNAILIIEFANIKFNEGMSLFDAAIESARLRFRPILMTAFSFILGIMPLIFASGSGALARKVMGMALLGGMGIATLFGVFIYPMLFVFIGKLFGYEKKRELAQTKSAP
jgi:HAE1 family hydrophobic/amphiphilic exporter-1